MFPIFAILLDNDEPSRRKKTLSMNRTSLVTSGISIKFYRVFAD